MSNRLYVGNLSFNTNESSLQSAFSRFGEIQEVRIVTDRDTGMSRGFGFVSMADSEGARAAIMEMNGAMVDGRALRVNEAEERSRGPRTGSARPFNGRSW